MPYGTNDGKQAIGIQAAARAYFNKRAADLTLAESALLAGLPQAPSDYNPFRAPGAATARRNEVLRKMADLGYISDSDAQVAISSRWSCTATRTSARSARASSSTTSPTR